MEFTERLTPSGKPERKRARTSLVVSTFAHIGALGLAAFAATNPEVLEHEIVRGQTVTIILTKPATDPAESAPLELDLRTDESSLPSDAPDQGRTTLEQRTRLEPPTVPDSRVEPTLVTEPAFFAVMPVRYEQEVTPDIRGSTTAKRPRVKTSVALAGFVSSPGTVSVARIHQGAKFNVPPKKLPENKPPDYPDREQRAGIEGRVMLLALIGSNGRVVRLAVQESSGSDRLDESAMAAVSQWRFSPALQNGNPVEAEILVPIRYSIRSS